MFRVQWRESAGERGRGRSFPSPCLPLSPSKASAPYMLCGFHILGNGSPMISSVPSILRVDPAAPSPEALKQACAVIRSGGVIAYPTETVYGLGSDPFNPEAVERIYAIKGRDRSKALILLVPDEQTLQDLTEHIPDPARRLMDRFWPGPLTLIFKASPRLPATVLGGGQTVALRISSHPLVRALLSHLRAPLTSSSANRSQEPPAQSAQDVLAQLGSSVDLILDAGPSENALPSTVVDVSTGNPILLRQGRIPFDQITHVAGQGGRT